MEKFWQFTELLITICKLIRLNQARIVLILLIVVVWICDELEVKLLNLHLRFEHGFDEVKYINRFEDLLLGLKSVLFNQFQIEHVIYQTD